MSDRPSFFAILSRCLRSRCPVCGRGRLFARIKQIKSVAEFFLPLQACDSCGFHFARQPGYYLGVITPLLPILALIAGVVFAGVAYFGFHQELEVVLGWGATGAGIGFLLFFRTAIAIYMALDHAIDPPKGAKR
jgi:uncharacterized protein (DUF983 family)